MLDSKEKIKVVPAEASSLGQNMDRKGFLRLAAVGIGSGIAGLFLGGKLVRADPPSEMVIDDNWIQLLSQTSDPIGSTDYAGRMWRSSSGYIKFTIDGTTAEFLEKQSNKGIASGYASLDSSVLVPAAQEGTGVADSTKYLRGDRSWQVLPAVPTFATPAILLGSSPAAGSAGTVIRSDSTIAAFDTTVPGTSTPGDAAAVGSIAFAARRDHIHGRESYAVPSIALGSSAAAGVANALIRADATIAAFDATVPTISAVGDAASVGVINFAARRDHLHGREAFGTPGSSAVGDSANAGVATTLPRSDHRHGREAFVTPSILLGTAGVAGVATTLIRSDSTIAAFDAIAPTISAVGDVAAVGSIAFAARRDHVHGREAFGTPGSSAVGDSIAAGTATTLARSDHRHGRESFATPAILLGSSAAAGIATTPIRSDGTIAAFDTSAPTNSAVADVAAVGVINFAARRDHLHGREAFATPLKTTPNLLSAAGVAITLPRSDHAHQSPGGVTGITADVAIANTETAVITFTPGANFLQVGTIIRIRGMGTLTTGATPGSVVLNVRCGTNATTGTVVSTITVPGVANQTNVGFNVDILLIVRTTGASGTCIAEIITESQAGYTAPITRNSATTATAVIDTTSASTIISLSMISGNAGSTYTWKVASIEVVKM